MFLTHIVKRDFASSVRGVQPHDAATPLQDELSAMIVQLLMLKAPYLRRHWGLHLDSAVPPAPAQCDASAGDRSACAPPATAHGGQGGAQPAHLRLAALPVLLEGHTPDVDALPEFLVQLAVEVEWGSEETRFQGVAAVCPMSALLTEQVGHVQPIKHAPCATLLSLQCI